MRIIFIFTLLAGIFGEEMPAWVLPGLLAVETSSNYTAAGEINWVDRSRGKSGERGAFQMTKAAFATVARPGEKFSDLDSPAFAEAMARRYLLHLYNGKAHGSWTSAVIFYNTGSRRSLAGRRYLAAVRTAGS